MRKRWPLGVVADHLGITTGSTRRFVRAHGIRTLCARIPERGNQICEVLEEDGLRRLCRLREVSFPGEDGFAMEGTLDPAPNDAGADADLVFIVIRRDGTLVDILDVQATKEGDLIAQRRDGRMACGDEQSDRRGETLLADAMGRVRGNRRL